MSIGEKLENLIRIRNRNVNDVAKAAGISPSTVYSIIRRNNTKVEIDALLALADELNVQMDYFCDVPYYEDDPYPPELETLFDYLYTNPALRELVDTAKDLSHDDIDTVTLVARKIRGVEVDREQMKHENNDTQ